MKTHISLALAVCLLATVVTQAAGDVPKPSAGHEKMLEWCGQATITGKTFTTPLGSGRDIKGKWIGKPILGGFAIEGVYLYEGQGPVGETQGKETITYDPVANKYHYAFVADNGYTEQAPFTQEDAVAAWEATCVRDGKQYRLQGRDTDLPDGSGFVRREKISADGKTWLPLQESRFVFAESTSDEQELIRLANIWVEAEVKGDTAAMAPLWAEDFTYSNSVGTVDSKSQALATMRAGDLKITSSTYDHIDARVYGDAGVTTGVASLKGHYKTTDISGKYRFTDTWIKRDGRWQCVATHASKVAEDMNASGKTIEGLWNMHEQKVDGVLGDRENRRALKLYQDGTLLFVDCNTATGKIDVALGGNYTFDGATLVETLNFANVDEWLPYRGISFNNGVRLEGDTFHQSGDRMGSMLEEVWKRVTPK